MHKFANKRAESEEQPPNLLYLKDPHVPGWSKYVDKIQFNSIQLYFHKNTTAKIHQEKKTYIQQNHMEE